MDTPLGPSVPFTRNLGQTSGGRQAAVAGEKWRGTHAEVKPNPTKLVVRSTLSDGSRQGPFEIPMVREALLAEAERVDKLLALTSVVKKKCDALGASQKTRAQEQVLLRIKLHEETPKHYTQSL